MNYIKEYVPDAQSFEGVVGKDVDLETIGLSEYTKYAILNDIPMDSSYQIRSYGGIGCFMSHQKLWENLINSNNNSMFVMEEDVLFNANFKTDYPKLLNFIENESEPCYILLGYTPYGSPSTKRYNNLLDEITGVFWGTQSYLINTQAAQILYDKSKCIDSQVDTFMSIVPGIKKLSSNPVLTTQKFHTSSILNPSLKMLIPNSNYICLIMILVLVGIIIILSTTSCNAKLKRYKCKLK
jgi:GR25 family glycosyltransferase involved in LPS biosynthesis